MASLSTREGPGEIEGDARCGEQFGPVIMGKQRGEAGRSGEKRGEAGTGKQGAGGDTEWGAVWRTL